MSYEGLLQRWRIYDDINYKLSILRYYSDYTKFPALDITQNNSNKMPMIVVYTYVYKIWRGLLSIIEWCGSGNTCVINNVTQSHAFFVP